MTSTKFSFNLLEFLTKQKFGTYDTKDAVVAGDKSKEVIKVLLIRKHLKKNSPARQRCIVRMMMMVINCSYLMTTTTILER
nr:hypothetical protein CFP56_47963 [Quercus suber]